MNVNGLNISKMQQVYEGDKLVAILFDGFENEKYNLYEKKQVDIEEACKLASMIKSCTGKHFICKYINIEL